MKRIFLSLLVMFLAISCVSSPDGNEATYSVTTEQVYNPVLEVNYYSDGVEDGQILYSYNNDGLLVVRENLNSEGSVVYKAELEYSQKLLIKETLYSGTELVSYTTYTYDNYDRVIEERSFNEKDMVQMGSDYQYDNNGRKIVWIILDNSLIPKMETHYIYEEDLLVRIEFRTPTGELDGYQEKVYSESLLIEEITYSSDGLKESQIKYSYSNGMVDTITYIYSGSVSKIQSFEYDDMGNAIKTSFITSSGHLLEYSIIEYEQFEIEVKNFN